MKSPKLVGMILGGLSLSFVGCEPPKSASDAAVKTEHAARGEGHEGPTGFSSPVPPVDPSPIPELPSTAKGESAKKKEAKTPEKKAEEPARTEAPK